MIAHLAVAAGALAASAAIAQPCEQAVVPQAGEGMSVVQAEHDWLRKTYGGGSVVKQALGASDDGKRRYDLVTWRKPDGQTVVVCFDVTTVFEDQIRRIEEEERGGSRSPSR